MDNLMFVMKWLLLAKKMEIQPLGTQPLITVAGKPRIGDDYILEVKGMRTDAKNLKKLLYAALNNDMNFKIRPRSKGDRAQYVHFLTEKDLKISQTFLHNHIFHNSKVIAKIISPKRKAEVKKNMYPTENIELQVNNKEKPTQNIKTQVNNKKEPKQKDDSSGKINEPKTNGERYEEFSEEDYKKQIACKVEDVAIQFEKLKYFLIKMEYKHLITQREIENGSFCPIEDFRTNSFDQRYSDTFKFYIGINTKTKEPALGLKDEYGIVKKMKMKHNCPDHIIKTVKVFEDAVKASKMAPRTPSAKTRVWHEVIIRTNLSEELMLLVLVLCPTESSADDLKNLKRELTELFQKGEGKQCRVVSLYMKVVNMVRAQKVWGYSEGMELIMGTPFLEETLLDFKFHLSPSFEFSQNRHTVKAICNGAEEMLCPLDKMSVLLVGCSIGVYGFYMSKIAKEVLCIDTNDFIEEAKKNAKLNSITDCQFFGGDYEAAIFKAAVNITCAESCAVVVITDSNQSFISNSTMIELRRIKSLKKIVLVLELPNSRFDRIFDLSFPYTDELYSPFFPVSTIPVDSAQNTNSYVVLILMVRLELASLPSLSREIFAPDAIESTFTSETMDKDVSLSLKPCDGNLDPKASTIAGTADNPSAASLSFSKEIGRKVPLKPCDENLDPRASTVAVTQDNPSAFKDHHIREPLALKQRRLIEEQKMLAEIEQQRKYLEEQQLRNALERAQRRNQLEEEHKKRRFEEQEQITLLRKVCQKRLFEDKCHRKQFELELQMKIYEREQLEESARGTHQFVRFLLAVEDQRKKFTEEQERRQLEDKQQMKELEEEKQRRVMEDKQQMSLFEEAERRKQLEEELQIQQFEEEKNIRLKEWQMRQLEEEGFQGKQLEKEWERRHLEGEWQINKCEEQQRGHIEGEWQVRHVEEQRRQLKEEGRKKQLQNPRILQLEEEEQKNLLEEEQQKRMLEEWQRTVEQKKKQVKEEHKKRQLEEEQPKRQLLEEQQNKLLETEQQKRKEEKIRLEKERQWKLLEEARLKKLLLEEECLRKQLEEEQKKIQLEEEEKKNRLEKEKQKKKLEEMWKKRELEEKRKRKRLKEEKRIKRLEEEQKRKKREDEWEMRILEEERCKRKLEEAWHKREFEEKQKKPRWEEERKHMSQRSKDDAVAALISNTLALKRDSSNKYIRSESQLPVTSTDNRNTSGTQHCVSDWDTKISDSRYSYAVASVQNRSTSGTQHYVPDWNTKSSDNRYSCGVTSIQDRNTCDTQRYVPDWNTESPDKYSYGDNVSQNMTDDRYGYNKDRCSETPSSRMNQGISADTFSFKDTLSQILQEKKE